MPAAAAYRAAGFKADSAVYVNASRLLRYAQIQHRISELQEAAARQHLVTRDSLIAELDRAIDLAHEKGQASAAIAGVVAKAKMLGLDEPHTGQDEGVRRFENMSDDEIRYMWANMLADIRAVKATLPPKLIEHN